jgi:hypothetical protein
MAEERERRGGRKKGTPNKKTAEMQAEIAATGETPLQYMLRILRDESVEPARRDAMAKSAAPYVHPQLSAVKHGGDGNLRAEYTVITWRKAPESPEKADEDDLPQPPPESITAARREN